MASIRKRGQYQWEARVRRKGFPIQCKTFETKALAEEWVQEVELEMRRGAFVSRKEAEQTTLNEALERYIEEYAPKLAEPVRQANRARAIQRRTLAKRFMAAIRGKDISTFIKEREAEGVSGNTIRLDLALLSRLFEIARTDWGMESLSNPVKIATKPKVAKGRTRRLMHGEEELLLEHSPARFKPVFLFALETAMRREEIASLKWENVNMRRRIAHLPETKNGESRTVPLSPRALEILENLPRNINGSVFGVSSDYLTRTMMKIVKKAELEDLRFHDLRHEATSRFFEETDLDVMEIREITGHKTMQMLARYSHLRSSRLADRLAGARRGEA